MSERTNKILFRLAMLVPPWNIFWWGVGIIWCIWSKIRHGHGLHPYMVIFAPYMLPWYLATRKHYQKLAKQREDADARHIAQCVEATAWIVRELNNLGMRAVAKEDTQLWSCQIAAEVRSDQWYAYQHIYAGAIRQFTALSPRDICYSAEPLEPLNEAWARSIGIDEWAASHVSLPCCECGKQEQFCWRWGNAVEHLPEGSDKELTINNHDGSSRTILHAYLCRDCGMKYESYSYVPRP